MEPSTLDEKIDSLSDVFNALGINAFSFDRTGGIFCTFSFPALQSYCPMVTEAVAVSAVERNFYIRLLVSTVLSAKKALES